MRKKNRGAAAMLLLLPLLVFSQPVQSGFEIASIKPTAPGDLLGSTYGFNPGGIQVRGGTLRGLVQMAYNVPDFEIFGGPGWGESERYDVSAKTASGERDSQARMKDYRQRLQTLLAERFGLQVHRENKEIPVYILALGKNGAKLTAAPGPPAGVSTGCGQITGTRATMASLVWGLTRLLRRPVIDRTGLYGQYDFKVEFTPDAGGCAGPAGTPAAESLPDALERPSIFTAVQETLGLRLESGKGPVEVVVIDRASKPDAN